MKIITLRNRRGSLIPAWIKCFFVGLVISWVVALGHWSLVEVGWLPRLTLTNGAYFVHNAVLSGEEVVRAIRYEITGEDPSVIPTSTTKPQIFRYHTLAYGWPFPNLGTIFIERRYFMWQLGIEPVVALDMRALWTPMVLPDPFSPDVPTTSPQFSNSLWYDPFVGYLPIFPLFEPTLLAGLLYGTPLFLYVLWRRRVGRRGSCEGCGYHIANLSKATPCPECGKVRTELQHTVAT